MRTATRHVHVRDFAIFLVTEWCITVRYLGFYQRRFYVYVWISKINWQCENDNGKLYKRCNNIVSQVSWMITAACSLVVGLGWGLWLGLDLLRGWLVVMHTYLYYFPLSLSHRLWKCRLAHFCGQHLTWILLERLLYLTVSRQQFNIRLKVQTIFYNCI